MSLRTVCEENSQTVFFTIVVKGRIVSAQRFWIGGLAYTYEGDFDLDVTMWPSFYRGFDQPQPLPDGDQLVWRVHLAGCGASRPAGTPELESESWSLWRQGMVRTIAFDAAPHAPPRWTAAMDLRAGRAEVRWDSRMEYARSSGALVENLLAFNLDRFLTLYRLAESGSGMLVHGAATDFSGQGWLFMGRSGHGKSTLSNLLHQTQTALVLSDERAVVRKLKNGFWLCGTPWPSSAGFAKAAVCPLRGLVFLEHGTQNELIPLKPPEALRRLLVVSSCPWHDKDIFDPLVTLGGELAQTLPAWELRFLPNACVTEFLRERLAGNRSG